MQRAPLSQVRRVFAIAFIVFSGGCGSLDPKGLESFKAGPGESKTEITGVPFFPQETNQCGPASLASVLSYQGIQVTAAELKSVLFLPGREGTLQIDMMATARRFGTVPYPLQPSWDALQKEVAAGHPVLVLQNLAFDWWPQWHYAIVIGFNRDNRTVILRSGNNRRYVLALSTFLNTWSRSGHWALVILPPGKAPVSLSASQVVAGILPLEPRQADVALEAYRMLANSHPAESLYAIASGNLLLSLGRIGEAVRAYRMGLDQSPEEPVLWNNLAWGLNEAGCLAAARRILLRGLKLNPFDLNLQKSLKELEMQPIDLRSNINDFTCPRLVSNGIGKMHESPGKD
ncbi:PA2778 family cysteine peptidase [Marinobacterium jannaschii]|uniref:PA2778 family cysteine peptidase n=1 Tax=Marinobacterium jannaschii TaxID=64970 RepID=UPI00068450A6|nr:PA2778 family cysteine peptidase [Marinobacterium jannaschii]